MTLKVYRNVSSLTVLGVNLLVEENHRYKVFSFLWLKMTNSLGTLEAFDLSDSNSALVVTF